MKQLLFWLSVAGVAATIILLTSKAGWHGLLGGIGISILSMISIGCKISQILGKGEKK